MVPNVLRGGAYPTTKVQKCHRFHGCLATKKCQNYSPHCRECVVCEGRIWPAKILRGHISSGEYKPDIQESLRMLQRYLRRAFNDRDGRPTTSIGPDVSDKHHRLTKALDILKEFEGLSSVQIEEKLVGELHLR